MWRRWTKKIIEYLTRKQGYVQELSAMPRGQKGAMLLSGQCCRIGKLIWSCDRTVISASSIVLSYVDHAERCLNNGQLNAAENSINEAYGYDQSEISLHRVAAKVGLQRMRLPSTSDVQRVRIGTKTMERIFDGLELSRQDDELLSIKSKVEEILSASQNARIAAIEATKKTGDAGEGSWELPESVKQIQRQQEERKNFVAKHQSYSATRPKKRERTKVYSRLRRPDEVTDSDEDDSNSGDHHVEQRRNSSPGAAGEQVVTDGRQKTASNADKRETQAAKRTAFENSVSSRNTMNGNREEPGQMGDGRNASQQRPTNESQPIRYARNRVIGTSSSASELSRNDQSQRFVQRPTELAASRDVYSKLIRRYEITFGCDVCVDRKGYTASLLNSIVSTGHADSFVRLHILEHACSQDRMLLRPRIAQLSDGTLLESDLWISIRSCPRNFDAGSAQICESFLSGEQCRTRARCPFPHGYTERNLWIQHFSQHLADGSARKNGVNVERFVLDMTQSSFRCRYELEQLGRELAKEKKSGHFQLACKICHVEGKGSQVGKRQHKPVCENDHPWTNQILVFTFEDNSEEAIILDRSSHTTLDHQDGSCKQRVLECFKRLVELRFNNPEIAEEWKKLKQRWQKCPPKAVSQSEDILDDLRCDKQDLIDDDRSSTVHSVGEGHGDEVEGSQSSNFGDNDDTDDNASVYDVRDDPEQIYDDAELDEMISVCFSSDAESNDDDEYCEEPYYTMYPEKELRELLETQPDRYKRCVIHLDGPFRARCRMQDEGFIVPKAVNAESQSVTPEDDDDEGDSGYEIREVEVRGRANCGPCFTGDEVVVELKETKELDGDKVIYRGTVVGILKKNIVRKNHTFLCRVDAYQAHLMKPLDGVAPKVHVVHSIVKNRHPAHKDELVAVYKMVDGNLKLVKIVKLDPKKRRDMLFVVKYLSWKPGRHNMYPIGYVSHVIKSGDSLQTSQRILNLLHQVPTNPSPDCTAAASSLDPDNLDDGIDPKDVEDLRGHLVISIDPDGCRDVDDALSLRQLPNGGFFVGVHIADVSRYVTKGDTIDKDASRRVTSFYAATKKVYHMLPERLSQDLCSLVENDERRTISVYFQTNSNFEIVDSLGSVIRRSLIRNACKLTYEQAQAYIDEARRARIPWNPHDIRSVIVHLNEIARRMRVRRLLEGRFYVGEPDETFCSFDTLICREAHQLVEEMMIRTNAEVARLLVQRYPHAVPVRRQREPSSDEIEDWLRRHQVAAPLSFYFRQFKLFRSKFAQTAGNDLSNELTEMVPVLESTVAMLEQFGRCGDEFVGKAVTALGAENRHPLHMLALHDWYKIQEAAEYVCNADLISAEESPYHFSLGLPAYVQFTSPIRRYMDLVIHRFVVAALDGLEAPYTAEEVRAICIRVNRVNGVAKRFSRACRMLSATEYLKTPFFLPCVVEDFDDDELSLHSLHLPHLKRSQSTIKYSQLALSDKPVISKDKKSVNVDWERRMYDTRPNHPFARTRATAAKKTRIDVDRHSLHIEANDYQHLLRQIVTFDRQAFRTDVLTIVEEARNRHTMKTERLEVTSEMQRGEPLVRHQVRFGATYKRGTVLAIQYGAEVRDGYMQPVPRLLNLTGEKDICIEHRTEAIRSFAELATDKVLLAYRDIEHYKSVWLPILSMEAAVKAVSNGDSLLCQNVPVSLTKRNDRYYGILYLQSTFCKQRSLKLFPNTKEGEDETSDYLCIRCYTGEDVVHKTPTVECVSFVRNVWVCHAVANYVSLTENEMVCLEFEVRHCHSPPPDRLLSGGRRGGVKCTVEFITKLLPDRFASLHISELCKDMRMEDAVKNIHDSSELCKSIVLRRQLDSLVGEIVYPVSDTYDINVDSSIRLKKNNEAQTHAIREALKGSFTLIQGPPGTGKTLTGIKLVYWYVHMNREAERNGRSHAQVLYCGPSNSSVDVAAKMLKSSLGSKCPRIVRVYSEVLEKQVYPVPRDSASPGGNQKGRRYELIDKDTHRDIALHHLIRKQTNSFHRRIHHFDRMFDENRDSPENVTDEQIEEYTKLITDAAIEELKRYEVILCTCSASASPRMIRGANVRQLVIDEGGMCMEPECLVPLRAFKDTSQVVVIGDHRQLQPIVMDRTAKDCGLDTSLFERYKDRAIMLTQQYRMHPRICEFPSRQFYEDKLLTAPDHECRGLNLLPIWPRRSWGIPMVFCHVEGAEKSQAVSTAEGNEQSKSNNAEKEEAVRIFLQLVNRHVDPDKITILSQYRAQCSAIEQNLKEVGFPHPNVNTVIASQGDEWDYVILSLVRSMPQYEIEAKPSVGWCKRNMGFITDEHQINVALTRARLGLIIIGNQYLLRCNPMWRDLLQHYRQLGCIVRANQFLPSRNRIRDFQPQPSPPQYNQQQRAPRYDGYRQEGPPPGGPYRDGVSSAQNGGGFQRAGFASAEQNRAPSSHSGGQSARVSTYQSLQRSRGGNRPE